MDKKTLFAFFLIAIVLILMPYYMKIVAPQEQQESPSNTITTAPAPQNESVSVKSEIADLPARVNSDSPAYNNVQQYVAEQIVTVETDLYSAKLSNRNGGSFTSFILKNYKA
ncbi:MAG: hypothetical protein MUP82_02130, partial [Candidatus Marinimicrobia bacterium]|nr:hypothetical protein [Candidatus Neomarinimicrobiota bacterium]